MPASCQHYGQTPPVDPADHKREGAASAMRERVAPTFPRCTPVVVPVPAQLWILSLIGRQLSTVPPVAGLIPSAVRCRRLILPPARQETPANGNDEAPIGLVPIGYGRGERGILRDRCRLWRLNFAVYQVACLSH